MIPATDGDQIFGALADPTRRRLLERLGEGPPTTASVLAQDLPVSRQAVVRHLGVLEAALLVRRRRVGREVRFQLEPDRLAEAGSWLTDRADRWRTRLELLKAMAEADR